MYQDRVILWDIDGTLLDSAGTGIKALSTAIEEHFSGESPPLNLAGATDSGVYRSMCDHFDRKWIEAEQLDFFQKYLIQLEKVQQANSHPSKLYDGVVDVLEEMKNQGVPQGLLTGNIERGAFLKTQVLGIESFFQFGAYGCDHWDRNELGPVGAQRASTFLQKDIKPEDLLIIGDTPRDIACARACGAKVIAVTTGAFSADQLQDADLVIDNLREILS